MSTYGWTRSSFCGSSACVEVRSTFCAAGDCVTASWADGEVLVRDSKLGEQSPVQRWSPEEWQELHRAIRLAEHSLVVAHEAVEVVTWEDTVVSFGLARHEDALWFELAEWDVFCSGVVNGEFTPEVLAARAAAMKDQPEAWPAEATDGSPVAAGVDAATPAPAPDSPVINFRLLEELRDREHPLLHIVPEIVDG